MATFQTHFCLFVQYHAETDPLAFAEFESQIAASPIHDPIFTKKTPKRISASHQPIEIDITGDKEPSRSQREVKE